MDPGFFFKGYLMLSWQRAKTQRPLLRSVSVRMSFCVIF